MERVEIGNVGDEAASVVVGHRLDLVSVFTEQSHRVNGDKTQKHTHTHPKSPNVVIKRGQNRKVRLDQGTPRRLACGYFGLPWFLSYGERARERERDRNPNLVGEVSNGREIKGQLST